MLDPITSAAHLAAHAPWWEPGTASGYHAFNDVDFDFDGPMIKTFTGGFPGADHALT